MYLMILMFVFVLITILYMLFYVMSYKMVFMMESSSGYECGFNFMGKTRISFSYRFFLIGILFLIFDVEIVLLLSIPFMMVNEMITIMLMMFIGVLILGLLYEYYCGSLEWIELFISKA